ncbi:hypothetical protein ACFQ60_23475 [Streptomyces zhihengii]
MMRLAITPWLLLLTAPLVITLLFRMAPPAARPNMRRGCGRRCGWCSGTSARSPRCR